MLETAENTDKMRVGIIGAGISGILSAKCCKEEGLDAVCFEMTDRIGTLHF